MTKLGLTLFILISISAFGGDAQVGEECGPQSNPAIDLITAPVLSSCVSSNNFQSIYKAYDDDDRWTLKTEYQELCACVREQRSVTDLSLSSAPRELLNNQQCQDFQRNIEMTKVDFSFHSNATPEVLASSLEPSPEERQQFAGIQNLCPDLTGQVSNLSLLTNDDGGPNRCMSSREFLAFSKVPQFNPFYKFMGTTEGQDPSNWDYDLVAGDLTDMTQDLAKAGLGNFSRQDFLRSDFIQTQNRRIAEYNGTVDEADRIEIPDWQKMGTLVEQIYFLNSNPLIRDFLRDSVTPATDKRKLIENFTKTFLGTDRSCINRTDPNSCKDDALSRINFTDFNQKIMDFYGSNALAKNRAIQTRRFIGEAQSLARYQQDPRFREAVYFERELNLDSRMCDGSSSLSESCLSQVSEVCSVVQPATENQNVGSGNIIQINGIRGVNKKSSFVKKIEEESLKVFDTPNNQDYEQFIQDLCSNPSPNREGIRLTFAEYYARRCSGSMNCPSRQNLLVDYLNEFKRENIDVIRFFKKSPQGGMSLAAARSFSRVSALRDALGNFNTETSASTRERTLASPASPGTRTESPAPQSDSSFFNSQSQSFASSGFVSPISSTPTLSPAFPEESESETDNEELQSARQDRERFDAELARIRQEFAQMQSREPRDSAAEDRIRQLEQQVASMAAEARRREEYLRNLSSQREPSPSSARGRSIASTDDAQASSPLRSSNAGDPLSSSFGQRRTPLNETNVLAPAAGGQAAFSGRAILGGSSAPGSVAATQAYNSALSDRYQTQSRGPDASLVVSAASLGPRINLSQEYYNLVREGKFAQLPSSVQNEILASVQNGLPPIVAHNSNELVATRVDGEIRFLTRAEYDQRFGNRLPASVNEPEPVPDCQDAARLGSLNSLLGVSAGVDSACPN